MGTVIALAKKDLTLLMRDRLGFFWTLGFPILMALFFGTVFSGSGGASAGAIRIGIQDLDRSDASRALIDLLEAEKVLSCTEMTREAGESAMRNGKIGALVTIRKGFGNSFGGIFGGDDPALEVRIDPSRKMTREYLRGILIQDGFLLLKKRIGNRDETKKWVRSGIASLEQAPDVEPEQKRVLGDFLTSLETFIDSSDDSTYGGAPGFGNPKIAFIDFSAVEEGRSVPHSSFEITFPQAVIWGLIACATTFALSIVTERVQGTFLRLVMMPISRGTILAGKATGCLIACLGEMLFVLLLGHYVFGVRLGDPLILSVAVLSTALCFVAIMMFISMLGRTERAVSGAGWAILLVMAMTGGGMIPLFVMPSWMQAIGSISPVKWSILALEGAIWRGMNLSEIAVPCSILLGCTVLFAGLARLLYPRSAAV